MGVAKVLSNRPVKLMVITSFGLIWAYLAYLGWLGSPSRVYLILGSPFHKITRSYSATESLKL